jgi:hypothetical protein
LITSHAHVPTASGGKYLVQLSKHWSHRFPDLTYTADRADIPLPAGPCVLEARDDAIDLTVSAGSEEDLARLEQVVADHLKRFAHREELQIDWRRAA